METKAAIMREQGHQLLNGEALFKALVQSSGDILILTNQLFRLDYISDAVTKILGYYPDELRGRTGFEIVHPDDREFFAGWLAQLVEGTAGCAPVTFRMRNSVGGSHYVEASGKNMLNDEAVGALVITCRDIQAKKIADQALVQAEQRLTLLLNNTKESFIILNSRLRVTAYNKAAQEYSPFFFTKELQSGLSFLELIPGNEADSCLALLEKVAEGVEQQKDTQFTDPAGKQHIYHHLFRSIDLGSEGKGVIITSSDITEKRQAEIELQRNKERFETIIEYSFDAVVIIDENAVVRYASPSVTQLVGFSPADLLGKSGFELIHPDDLAEVKAKLASIVNEDDETYADYRSITKEGSYKWLEAKGKNMFGNPHINGILVSFRDVTQRKQMMEEQRLLTHELVKYNKDLQQFSFITSHNLRAPVANLMSLLSLYNHNDLADPFNAEILDKLEKCTQQLNDTLNDLINVLVIRSRPNADREYVRFSDVANHTLANVQVLLGEAGGMMETDFSAVEGVEYNKVHMESIFLNLVSNSIKYAAPERNLKITICSEKTNEGVKLTFTDNGIGVDLNRYGDRIFGLYQRFHAAKEGKGLGLYMIKSQIISGGGSIKVQSEPGVGTSFFVHLKTPLNRLLGDRADR
jgi:PAS domain S-box-containing protein